MKKLFSLFAVLVIVSPILFSQQSQPSEMARGHVPSGDNRMMDNSLATGKIPLSSMLRTIATDLKRPNPRVRSKDGEVTIYADHDNGLYGRSLYRTVLLTVRDALYKRTDTYYVNKDIGSYLTAVTLNFTTSTALQEVMKSGQPVYLGDYEISIDQTFKSPVASDTVVYRFRNNKQNLDMSFSIEPTPEDMLSIIEQFYIDDPKNRDIVINHYKSSCVIRVFSAENFIDPWNHEISINEALVMATYIGDLEQPFWGIADGNAHLAKALIKMM
ncbi:MAG: hypothetical protein ACRCVN_07345 [Spirochaetia bacterium]